MTLQSGTHPARVLKRDAFGRIERIDLDPEGRFSIVRRVACGGRIPGSARIARLLLRREREALRALDGLAGVPRLVGHERTFLDRTWIEGTPLHEARSLPEDFFDRLDELVAACHARGVCHNDLHKEQNILVARDGYPALVDFQLASVHSRPTLARASRARDDLRHVEKHRRRYTRDGRGPRGSEVLDPSRGAGHGIPRSGLARVWRRAVKPLYVALTRGILRTRDGEARRESSGPWPGWTRPVGPRPLT
jgi:hypothetical protein